MVYPRGSAVGGKKLQQNVTAYSSIKSLRNFGTVYLNVVSGAHCTVHIVRMVYPDYYAIVSYAASQLLL